MLVDDIKSLVDLNRNATVSTIEAYPFFSCTDNTKSEEYFFCGAVVDSRGHIIGIPNKYKKVLEIDPMDGMIEQWGEIELPKHKGWTGGAFYNDRVYGFPRGADSFLEINTNERTICYKKLAKSYGKEHHYGGALLDVGVVYQPPRIGDQILKYNIRTDKSEEIAVKRYCLKRNNFLFYGAIADLRDNVYFFPAGKWARTYKIDASGNGTWIGLPMRYAFFNSGTLGIDGNIYGFSSYHKGILKIETETMNVKIMHKNLHGGYFGAKLGYNGKIYSIPGDADTILEYDPVQNIISSEIPIPAVESGISAKCAGGAIDIEGNIWCVPAKGHYIYKVCFDNIVAKPSEALYRTKYFRSFY